jgi:CRP-like cAMP-binding protein
MFCVTVEWMADSVTKDQSNLQTTKHFLLIPHSHFSCSIFVCDLFFFLFSLKSGQQRIPGGNMVWSASTLWAETSVGSFRDRWIESLQQRGMSRSAILSPPPHSQSPSRRNRSMSPFVSEDDDDDQFFSVSYRRSPSPNAQRDEGDEKARQQLEAKLDASAIAHEERALSLRSNKVAALRERRESREAHTRAVVERGAAQVQERVKRVQEVQKEREKRQLPAIDQCSDSEEQTNALRAASFLVICAAQRVLWVSRGRIRIDRTMKTFRCLLVPMMYMWRARRVALARTYSGIWRGKCNRPSVETLKAVLPAIQGWTSAGVQQLIKRMHPVSAKAGTRILSCGEPGASAFYVSSGRVAVRQPRLNAPSLELGERGAAYLHGEDVLTKENPIRHFIHLQAIEPTYGWYITRKAFLETQKVAKSQGDMVTAAYALAASMKSKTESYVLQAVENNQRLLGGWTHSELFDIIDQSTERTLTRGDVLYSPDEKRATHCYFIVRGTILIAQQVKRIGGGHNHRASVFPQGGVGVTGGSAELQLSHSGTDFNATSTSYGEIHPPEGAVPVGPLAAVEGEEFLKEYANTGQVIGADSILFSSPRTEWCICATDCAVLELPATPFIRGMFTNPTQLILNKEFYNHQRAMRLMQPTASQLFPHFLHQQPLAAFFLRNMFPVVVSRGEPLPLNNAIVFLQSGTVELEGRVFKAPSLLICFDAFRKISKNFDAAMKNGSLESIRADKDPTLIESALNHNSGAGGGDGGAGGGSGAKGIRSGAGVVRVVRKLKGGKSAAGGAPPAGVSQQSPTVTVVATATSTAGALPHSPATNNGGLTPAASPGASMTAHPPSLGAPTASTTATPRESDDADSHADDAQASLGSPASTNAPELPAAEAATALTSSPPADASAPHQPQPSATGATAAAHAATTAGSGPPSAVWGYIPLPGSTTLVVKQPFALRDGDAGDGNGRTRYRQLPAVMQLAILTDDLSERTQCFHKTTSRVEAWCVRSIDFIRKFYGNSTASAMKVSDYVRGEHLDRLTPLKDA